MAQPEKFEYIEQLFDGESSPKINELTFSIGD